MKKLLLPALIFMSFNAIASVKYTAEQLNSMDAKGVYPEQGAAVTKGVELVDFDACKEDVHGVYNQVAGIYPAKEIVDTSNLYIVKIWTNDGAVVTTCSRSDSKKIVTQAPYR